MVTTVTFRLINSDHYNYLYLYVLSFFQVDVVYVGNLHVQHMQSVMMMFEARKPVLCEKPMTTTIKETASIIQVARGKGLFLMEVRIACTVICVYIE